MGGGFCTIGGGSSSVAAPAPAPTATATAKLCDAKCVESVETNIHVYIEENTHQFLTWVENRTETVLTRIVDDNTSTFFTYLDGRLSFMLQYLLGSSSVVTTFLEREVQYHFEYLDNHQTVNNYLEENLDVFNHFILDHTFALANFLNSNRQVLFDYLDSNNAASILTASLAPTDTTVSTANWAAVLAVLNAEIDVISNTLGHIELVTQMCACECECECELECEVCDCQ